MKFTRTISTVLLLSSLATNALAGTNPCPCAEAKAKPVTRTTSKLVRRTPDPLRVVVAPIAVIHYDGTKHKSVSPLWYVAAAAAGVGIGYLIERNNDKSDVTNITVVAPGEDD